MKALQIRVNNIKKLKKQHGFTLIELVAVMIGIGILLFVLAPNFGGSKDQGTALLINKSSQTITGNWVKISQLCGTTSDAVYSPVIASGKTAGDVLFGGLNNVNATYAGCYNAAHVSAMSELGQATSNGWAIGGYTVTISGGGSAFLCTNYAGVPDSVVLSVAQQYNNQLQQLAASDTSSLIVQYSGSVNGVRTVAVCHQAS